MSHPLAIANLKIIYEQSETTTMTNDIYFEGKYYDSDTLTESDKKLIEKSNPKYFAILAKRYGYKLTAPKKTKQDDLDIIRPTDNTPD